MATRKSTTRKSTTRKKTVILHVWDYYDREQRYEPVNLRITGEGANKWRREEDPREALLDAVNGLFRSTAKKYNSITQAQVRRLNSELPNAIGYVEVEEV